MCLLHYCILRFSDLGLLGSFKKNDDCDFARARCDNFHILKRFQLNPEQCYFQLEGKMSLTQWFRLHYEEHRQYGTALCKYVSFIFQLDEQDVDYEQIRNQLLQLQNKNEAHTLLQSAFDDLHPFFWQHYLPVIWKRRGVSFYLLNEQNLLQCEISPGIMLMVTNQCAPAYLLHVLCDWFKVQFPEVYPIYGPDRKQMAIRIWKTLFMYVIYLCLSDN